MPPLRYYQYGIVFLILAVLSGCQGGGSDGLDKHPVTGTVLVDGEPAEGVVVRLFRDGKPGTTNADNPLAVTQEDGKFELATNGDKDGAVAGVYKVTFTWKESNSPTAVDRLGGQYTALKDSKFEVTLAGEAQELPPFELTSGPLNQTSKTAGTSKRRRATGLPPKRGG